MPGSPCLGKSGPVYGSSCSIFDSLLWTKGSLARVFSLPGAKVVCWRPHLAGTQQYIAELGKSGRWVNLITLRILRLLFDAFLIFPDSGIVILIKWMLLPTDAEVHALYDS